MGRRVVMRRVVECRRVWDSRRGYSNTPLTRGHPRGDPRSSVRAPLPRLLGMLLVVGVVTSAARAARAAPRIEEVEEALGHDRSYKVRVDAALVLGRLRQTRSIPALIGALKDPNPAVRASAAGSLGHIGSPIAKDAVAKALVDPVPLVRRRAKEALLMLGGADVDVETPPAPTLGAPAIRPRPGKK